MALVTPETKLCDVIIDEPSVIPVINRFDIELGVGDKTIKTICCEKSIDLNFFLLILNAFISESFVPEIDLKSIKAKNVIEYLRKTNNFYLQCQLPNIERHFNALIKQSDANSNLPLLFNFFKEVRKGIEIQIENDDKWFEEIIRHEQTATCPPKSKSAKVQQFDATDDKLNDLKNMFVIHLRGNYDRNLCHAVLHAIISLEKDIRQNDRIRNRILNPIATALKESATTSKLQCDN